MELRILVADEHGVARRALRGFLESRPGWKVCAEAASGREAVEKARRLKPDVAVVDMGMPQLGGLEVIRRIRKESPETGILVLTMDDSELPMQEALEAGAGGCIRKDEVDGRLALAVEALRQHQRFFSSRAGELAAGERPWPGLPGRPKRPRRDRLTPREREIVQLLAQGKKTRELAALLNITVPTVETHRANILRKLHLHSFSEVMRYAAQNKIVTRDP